MVFGFDVSTSVIGLSYFDNDGKLFHSDHIDLSKTEGMIEKMQVASRWFAAFLSGIKGAACWHEKHYVFIEERLGNFSAGRSMLQTLMKLAAFNFAFSWEVWCQFTAAHADCTLRHIHPSTVKAIMKHEGLIIPKGSKNKKQITLEFVVNREPTFPVDFTRTGTPKPYMFDRADAYITALAGIKRFVCVQNAS
ncbi:MAG: hypothetical protein ACYDHY_07585 [Acidiferrobacterales bacterium]